jgi:hypothetical protein
MPSIELLKKWKTVRTLLQRARRSIRNPPPQAADIDKRFNEYLEHNELELALSALEEISELVTCRGGFWRDLDRAAQAMGLGDRAAYFRTRLLNSRPKP